MRGGSYKYLCPTWKIVKRVILSHPFTDYACTMHLCHRIRERSTISIARFMRVPVVVFTIKILVLLNNGVLDIWWVLGGQSVDINKIHYRNIRLLSSVYQFLGYTYEMSSLYLPIIWVYIYSLSNHHPHQTEQFPLTISSSTIYPAYDQSWVCISRLYPGKKLMVLKWMKYK